jgi:glycosyltransferase involved in cell wall biosynthesis
MDDVHKHKILYLSAYNTPEAGNRVLLTWIKWLVEHEYKVALAYPGGGWMSDIVQTFSDLKVTHCSFMYPTVANNTKFILSVLKLVAFVIKNKIEIIHCNSEVAYRYGMYAARFCKIPIVTHFRFHFQEEYYKWSFAGKRCPSGVFFVSKAFHAEEISKLNEVAKTSRSWTLYNCINTDLYLNSQKDEEVSKSGDPLIIVYPAAIQTRKNQLHLYKIDRLLIERGVDVKFIVAGRINEVEYWEECQKKAQEYMNNNIEFIGHIDDVRLLYMKAHISISLSRYETFGFSVLESMACGVPVVSYADPAVMEVLGSSGIIVPIDDVEAVADAITLLSKDEKLRKNLSINSMKRAREIFSPDVIVPQLLRCYNEVTVK